MNVFVELIPFITGFMVGLGVHSSTFLRLSIIIVISSVLLGVLYNRLNAEPEWMLAYDIFMVAAGSFSAVGVKKLLSRLG